MSRKTCNTFGKIIALFLLSLILSLPLPAPASTKILVIFPLAIYADQSKAYLGQGIKSMLISRISGAGIEIVADEKYISLLGEKERKGIVTKERAEELARVLKADYAIFGSITTIGGGYSLDLSLVALEKDGSKLTRLPKAVDEEQLIPQLSDVAYTLRALIEGKEILSATQTADKPARKVAEKAAVLPKPRTAEGIFSQIEGDKKEPSFIPEPLLILIRMEIPNGLV